MRVIDAIELCLDHVSNRIVSAILSAEQFSEEQGMALGFCVQFLCVVWAESVVQVEREILLDVAPAQRSELDFHTGSPSEQIRTEPQERMTLHLHFNWPIAHNDKNTKSFQLCHKGGEEVDGA